MDKQPEPQPNLQPQHQQQAAGPSNQFKTRQPRRPRPPTVVTMNPLITEFTPNHDTAVDGTLRYGSHKA